MNYKIIVLIPLLLLLSIHAYCLNDMGRGGSFDGHAVAQTTMLNLQDFLDFSNNMGKGGSYDGHAMMQSALLNLSDFAEPVYPPKPPANIQITIIDSDVHISWDRVTEDIHGNPIEISHYEVYYHRLPNPFETSIIEVPVYRLLGSTFDTFFIHRNGAHSPRVRYKVIAVRID